jgi:hypothetical protein
MNSTKLITKPFDFMAKMKLFLIQTKNNPLEYDFFRKNFYFCRGRNGRAVECGGLENRCTFAGTGGSNPSFSAVIA